MRNIFYAVPDVPVSKFVLTMKGGKRGLLINTAQPLRAASSSRRSTLRVKAQNGKKRATSG